jgi:ribonuclease HI
MKKQITEKQISLFESSHSSKIPESVNWKMCIDGASRGNPGLATCGIVFYHNDKEYKKEGFFLNTMTNNQAEYMALVLGILLIKEVMQKEDTLSIISDSQLLVRQMQGMYKVKNSELIRMHGFASRLLCDISYTIEHVLRQYNQEADRAANQAFETRKKIPVAFLDLMKTNEIII